MNDRITRGELASRWDRTVGTLANWASMGRGPIARKRLNGAVYYLLSDVEAYERDNDMQKA